MKIAIDISRALESQKTGIPMYQANLFQHLSVLPAAHEYVPLYYGDSTDHVKQFMGQNILQYLKMLLQLRAVFVML